MAWQVKFERAVFEQPQLLTDKEFPSSVTFLGQSVDLTSLKVCPCLIAHTLLPATLAPILAYASKATMLVASLYCLSTGSNYITELHVCVCVLFASIAVAGMCRSSACCLSMQPEPAPPLFAGCLAASQCLCQNFSTIYIQISAEQTKLGHCNSWKKRGRVMAVDHISR